MMRLPVVDGADGKVFHDKITVAAGNVIVISDIRFMCSFNL